jgi:hypothetical protein
LAGTLGTSKGILRLGAIIHRADLPAFDRAALAANVEKIETFATDEREGVTRSNQLALL